MTSRERVLASIDHVQPDQVAVDFGGHRSSGIMALAYKELRRHLDLPDRPIKVYDMVQQLAVIDEDVLERFGVDTVELGRGFGKEDTDWKEWELPDGSPCLIPHYVDVRRSGTENAWILYSRSGKPSGIQREGMIYFDQIYWPYREAIPKDLSRLPEDLADVMWSVPSPPNLAVFEQEQLQAGVQELRSRSDRAVLYLFGGNMIEIASFLCSIETFMMLMAADPPATHRLLDRLVEMHLENLDRYLPLIGPYVDIVLFGDDLGMQSGPQISPAMYRQYFKPRHKTLWQHAKQLADVKVMLHSCGGLRPLLDDLIEAGLDAVNPVQTSAAGMDAEGLKRDFGDRICLWGGGCDTQTVLPSATPEKIRRHVLDRLEILSPGGGFVFQQVHNIMANVPPENITAMFDAVAEYNRR